MGLRSGPIEVAAAMELKIPDDILQRGQLGEGDVRMALAVQLYADNRIDHVDACRLAGVSAGRFNRALIRLGLSIQQYPVGLMGPKRSAG